MSDCADGEAIPALRRLIGKKTRAVVVIERHALVGEVADHQALAARTVVVAGVGAHAGARAPRIAESDSRGKAGFRECAVVIVVVELVRRRVVRNKKIDPAVVVVIQQRDAKRLSARIVKAGSLGHILESSVAKVVKEPRAFSFVDLGRAIGLVLAVERAELIGLLRPIDIMRDEEIELAVIVVVEPHGAGREA